MDTVAFAGWMDNLKRYPPAEMILADIWFLLANVFGMGKANIKPELMGNWLETPLAQEKRNRKTSRADVIMWSKIAAEAYKRDHGGGGKTT